MTGPALGQEVNIFGVNVTATTYDHATRSIIDAAANKTSYAVSALAVHGLMEAVASPEFRAQVNSIDLVTPDGQPVRWAMNALHSTGLDDRVYGPDLTWHVVEAAESAGLSLFLFGSTEQICEAFRLEIMHRHPCSRVVGVQADRFRDATADEDSADIATINDSGAHIVLVGRGCPRQEQWVADHRGSVNAAMLAVGAAFDYGAGALNPPPSWVQQYGLQWLFRLGQEPRRLWKRYLITNSKFLAHFANAMFHKTFTSRGLAE